MSKKQTIRATLNNVLLERIDLKWIVIDVGPLRKPRNHREDVIEIGDEAIVALAPETSNTSFHKEFFVNDKKFLLLSEEQVLGVIKTITDNN